MKLQSNLKSTSTNSGMNVFDWIDVPQMLIQSRTSYSGFRIVCEKKKFPSASEIINIFLEDGIPLAVFARIARVERKTIYSWLKGSHIRIENQNRLELLHNLFFTNKQASLFHLYRYW